ncbi:hypothetical protein ACFY2K_26140 [Kitasatospora sp. NPDC001309]|uniref:hypothetical protein n=1 Tax=Kitasatospora sp. NPDC001309 TaxID=3364013 RepID=UPI003676B928
MARVVRKIEIQKTSYGNGDETPLTVLERFVEEVRENVGMGVDPIITVHGTISFEYTED